MPKKPVGKAKREVSKGGKKDPTSPLEGAPAAVWVPVGSLTPWAENPRENTEAVPAVKDSVDRFGWGDVIVARKENGEVIAGHTRLKAAEARGDKLVPVRYVDLSEDEAHAFAIANNRTGEIATWVASHLGEELKKLEQAGIDLKLGMGFDEEELKTWMAAAEVERLKDVDEDEDSIIEPPAEPRSVPGEVYELGPHRLLCGDCTVETDWSTLMQDEKADMVWTDPPYGVKFEGGQTRDPRRADKGNKLRIKNDELSIEDLTALLRDAFSLALTYTRPGACWYVSAPAGPPSLSFGIVLTELDVWRQTLAWVKSALVFGRSDYHYRHEYIFYGWTPGAAHHALTDRTQDTVWEFDRPNRSHLSGNVKHPTIKPTELVMRAIENSSNPGELVVDGFAGSGTTMIAAAKTGRRAFLFEVDPRYCDVIRDRWEKFMAKACPAKAA